MKDHLPIDPSMSGPDNLLNLIDYTYPNIASILNFKDYVFSDPEFFDGRPRTNSSIRVTAKETALFRGQKTLYYLRFELSDLDGKEWIIPEGEYVPQGRDEVLAYISQFYKILLEEIEFREIARWTYELTPVPGAYTKMGRGTIIVAPFDTRIPLGDVIESLRLDGLHLPDAPPEYE